MDTYNVERISEGIEEAKRGNTSLGLRLLEGSLTIPNVPEAKAWYGYCLAREKNGLRQGISLCEEARESKPSSSDIYLALGRIYLQTGHRAAAVRVLKQGMRLDNNQEIYRLLDCIGIRKPPVFGFLNRSSKVNVASGRLLSWIGFR